VQLSNKPKVLLDHFISLVAEVSTASLLGKPLAGWAACEKVDLLIRGQATGGTQLVSGNQCGVGLENVIPEVAAVGLHGRGIVVEGSSHIEPGTHQA
jgi:hypothetical protein